MRKNQFARFFLVRKKVRTIAPTMSTTAMQTRIPPAVTANRDRSEVNQLSGSFEMTNVAPKMTMICTPAQLVREKRLINPYRIRIAASTHATTIATVIPIPPSAASRFRGNSLITVLSFSQIRAELLRRA